MITVRQVSERHIFPMLGMFIAAGTVTGAITSAFLCSLTNLGDHQCLVYGALSAGLGAILGLFVGLGRSAWHIGESGQTSDAPQRKTCSGIPG